MPGASVTGGTRERAQGSATTLTVDDAMAIRALPGVAAVEPDCRRSRSLSPGAKHDTSVIGTTPDYPAVRAFTVWQGSFLTDVVR